MQNITKINNSTNKVGSGKNRMSLQKQLQGMWEIKV